MRKNILMLLLIVSNALMAGIPEGYYNAADATSYLTLKDKLNTIISKHKVLGYNSLWEHYPSTYYHLDDTKRVYDMYSNTKRYYPGNGNAVNGMNKEHTVPQSWWGKGTAVAQGNDLYNVIPSDQDANGRKSNYPLGVVSSSNWSNGVTTVGKGTVNGHSDTFFEPCNEYKGDFARIYLYMAVCYPDVSWDSSNESVAFTNSTKLTLKSWIIPLLLQWHQQDPVSTDEIQRNEDIYKVQGNRNPFIDYPELAEYIWGSKTSQSFIFADHKPNQGDDPTHYAQAPKFSLTGGTADTPRQVVKGTVVTITGSTSTATLYVRTNGGSWQEYEPTTGWNSTTQSEYHEAATTTVTIDDDIRIDAYCTQEDMEMSEERNYYYQVVDFSQDYLLYEPFDEVTGGNNISTQGSSAVWEGNANFPEVSKVYQADGAVKLGTGSATGLLTSRPLEAFATPLIVSIDVKGWTTVEGKLRVSIGNDVQEADYSATMSDDFETVTLVFNNATPGNTLKIETTLKRAFISSVKVQDATANAIVNHVITPASTAIYDINGTRLNSSPKSGIYIINGRKHTR